MKIVRIINKSFLIIMLLTCLFSGVSFSQAPSGNTENNAMISADSSQITFSSDSVYFKGRAIALIDGAGIWKKSLRKALYKWMKTDEYRKHKAVLGVALSDTVDFGCIYVAASVITGMGFDSLVLGRFAPVSGNSSRYGISLPRNKRAGESLKDISYHMTYIVTDSVWTPGVGAATLPPITFRPMIISHRKQAPQKMPLKTCAPWDNTFCQFVVVDDTQRPLMKLCTAEKKTLFDDRYLFADTLVPGVSYFMIENHKKIKVSKKILSTVFSAPLTIDAAVEMQLCGFREKMDKKSDSPVGLTIAAVPGQKSAMILYAVQLAKNSGFSAIKFAIVDETWFANDTDKTADKKQEKTKSANDLDEWIGAALTVDSATMHGMLYPEDSALKIAYMVGGLKIDGARSESDITKQVIINLEGIRSAVDKASGNRNVIGDITVKVGIDAGGKTVSTKLQSSTLNNEKIEKVIAAEIGKFHFNSIDSKEGIVNAEITFLFE